MQEEPFQAVGPHDPIECAIAVFVIPGERCIEAHRMDTNLVGAPCTRLRHDQARDLSDIDGHEVGQCPLAVGVNPHETLARATLFSQQRRFAAASSIAEVASRQGQVVLADPTFPQRVVQSREHALALRDEETPRCVSVEPVDQLESTDVRPRGPQALDDAEIQTAASVHSPSRRLVQDNQSVIFVENRPLDDPLARRVRCKPDRGLDLPQWWNPNDANFSAANESIDTGARNVPEIGRQEVVDTLSRDRLVYANLVRRFPTRQELPVHRKIVSVCNQVWSWYSHYKW